MNYATEVSVYGMLPANAEFVEGSDMAVYKNKKHDAVITWDPNYVNGSLPVSYMYSDVLPTSGIKSKFRKFHLINGPFDESFFAYRGEHGRHFREYRNYFSKKVGVTVETSCPKEKTLDLIRRWEVGHGKAKYRMQMHSSYDKRFFNKSLELLGNKVDVLYFMHDGKCVGYKVLDATPTERPDGLLEFRSMLRKYDPEYKRLCLYVDMTAYEYLWKKWRRPFCVNVGCSSGGVAVYKKEKFPVMDAGSPVYFYKNCVEPIAKNKE